MRQDSTISIAKSTLETVKVLPKDRSLERSTLIVATFAVTFMLSLYLQFIKGLNPQSAGLILVFQPIFQAGFSPLAGRWSDRVEPRVIASIGMAITAAGLLQLVFLNPGTALHYVVAMLVLLGIGFALFSSPNMNAIMSSVEKKHFGIASGAVATMRLIGQMASMATATVVLAVAMGSSPISAQNHGLFLQSMRAVFVIFTLLCSLGIFFSLSRGALRGSAAGG